MCFSAEASFIGGIVISSIGVATIKKMHNPNQLLFASIPLFFGIQQIVEGFLWLSLPLPDYLHVVKISAYVFLIMAQVIWPIMIPLAILFMEKNKKRKKILVILLGLGFLLACYYTYCLLFYDIDPQIMNYHIRYNTDFPKVLSRIALKLYIVVAITPLFVSSIKRTHIMGILITLSLLISAFLFTENLASVWCFFAALISGVIYWILRDLKSELKLAVTIL